MTRKLLFGKNAFLAVLGDDGSDFWLARVAKNVYEGRKVFDVFWLEEDEKAKEKDIYTLRTKPNSIPVDSVICPTKLRCIDAKAKTKVFTLRPRDKAKIMTSLGKDDDDQADEKVNDIRGRRKRSLRKEKRTSNDETNDDDSGIDDEPPAKAKKGTKGKKEVAKKKKKTTKKDADAKKIKKAKREPKGPNWRLKPRPDIKVWEKDPLFESKSEVPFISSTMEGKLAIRAVLTRDMALLKRVIADKDKVHNPLVKRSMAVEMNALHYAIRNKDMASIKQLASLYAQEKKNRVKMVARVDPQPCMMPVIGTGKYNFRTLGIRRIRRLNMSRGGREGNNALTKDVSDLVGEFESGQPLAEKLMEWDTPVNIINELMATGIIEKHQVIEATVNAVRHGNAEIAAHFIEKSFKQFGGGEFNRYHHEALTRGDQEWRDPIREISARKRNPWGLTPLHCAAINPNISALKQLYAVCPDVNVMDSNHRKLVHYAAAAKSLEPMKFLLENGANLEDVDKSGMTPLMVAAQVGRTEMVKFIIKTLSNQQTNLSQAVIAKVGIAGVNKTNKESYTAFHLAVTEGNLEVVKILLDKGANVEKPLNSFHEKRTPLILASANADLDMVKFLAQHAKVEKPDRYKRTALTHAVMNGAANVASYLLSLGADPNKSDTSGNSNLHYACAYGWYFCMRILLDAGAEINASNEWKLTPVAVSILKGHNGIGKYLLDQPGVDINFRDDKGRNVVLGMIAEAGQERPLTDELLKEIKDMVERRNADPDLVDNEGKNALHYLSKYTFKPEEKENDTATLYQEKWEKSRRLHRNFVEFFLSKKCNVLKFDNEGYIPLMYLLECGQLNSAKMKDYKIASEVIEAMKFRVDSSFKLLEPKQNQPGLLNTFAENISMAYIEEENTLLKSIMVFLKKVKNWEGLVEVKSKDYLTPVMALCKSYASTGKLQRKDFDDSRFLKTVYPGLRWESNAELVGLDKKWKTFRSLITEFIENCNPSLSYRCKVEKETDRSGEKKYVFRTLSAVVIVADVPNERPSKSGAAFQMLLSKGNESLDGTDEHGETALVKAVKHGRNDEAKRLISAGANVNFVYVTDEKITVNDPDVSCNTDDEDEGLFYKSCPLLDATKNGNLSLVRCLLQNKADVFMKDCVTIGKDGQLHKKCLFQTSTKSCLINRKCKERLAILKELIASGIDVNIIDKTTRRNVLHVAINGSGDQADQSLDLEITLLRNGCNVLAKDFRNRLPLHYSFVKIGKHLDTSRSDPTEVCSMLLEAMNGQEVDARDEFGSTPLHYAAFRGATVCCLLLLQRGADINAYDHKGNTPLAYAIMGQHEGCALILIQKGANVNVDIHPMLSQSQMEKAEEKLVAAFKFLPSHFEALSKEKTSPYSAFQGLIENGWLGITYVALQQLESFGFSFARAVEVAFHMQKIQFAKNLIGKQVSVEKLQEKVTEDRNLISSLAFECKGYDATIQADVLELLLNSGVCCTDKDESMSSPLHYACMNRNYRLIELLLKHEDVVVTINERNAFGLTPLAALFWNYETSAVFKQSLELLLSCGADPNVRFESKPLSYVHQSFSPESKARRDFFINITKCPKVTPLIIALIHSDAIVIDVLLNKGKVKADLNLPDETGMTPIMHAVKTNNINIVVQLLKEQDSVGQESEKGAEEDTESVVERFRRKPKVNKIINLKAIDHEGFDVFDHAIQHSRNQKFKSSYDNAEMFELLLKCLPDIKRNWDSVKKNKAMLLAQECQAENILKKLGDLFKFPVPERLTTPESKLNKDCTVWSNPFNYNVLDDAQNMLKILEEKAAKEERARKKYPKQDEEMDIDSDSEVESGDDDESMSFNDSDIISNHHENNSESKKPKGCIVQDGQIYKGYSVLMTKIDVSFGAWGLYNFYRMQIWKEKHKDLWILFTNWGRIGGYDRGQFQNTPFGTAEQAVEEFEKIFKSKSGNEWANLENFQVKPKKYRPVRTELLEHVKKSALRFDLSSTVTSELPEDVADLVKDLANVSMYIDEYKKVGMDMDAVPFGRIKREVVEEAKKILHKLEGLVESKRTIDEKRRRIASEALNEQLFECLEEIRSLSSEYYHLMPKKGFEFTRLPPIDNQHLIQSENQRVNYMLEFEVAERLLLAAQYRKDEINPLDYIYRAVGCKLIPLDEADDKEEVSRILRYVYNSNGAANLRVRAIYKAEIPETEEIFGRTIKSGPLNRKLLWHGSKAANLLSILNKGLLVNAPYVPITGKAFGQGLYTADVFDKSWNYTFDWRAQKYPGGKYMMLCDVALGKSREVKEFWGADMLNLPGKGNHSVIGRGLHEPDPVHTLKTSLGFEIPLGRIVPVKTTSKNRNMFSSINYNEYVTYDSSQTVVRYIIRIENENETVTKSKKQFRPSPGKAPARGFNGV